MAAVASERMPEPSLPPSPSLSMERAPSRRLSDAAPSCDNSPAGTPDRASQLDHSPSSSRQLDFQNQSALRSKEYRQLFGLPEEEVHIQDFNCALQENMLQQQGHMYLFSSYICFYANFLSFETKRVIPFHEVTCVRRAKVAGIFPTAIEILTEEKKYFFASFLSREEAFKLINDGWSKTDRIKSITNQQEVQAGLTSQDHRKENGRAVVEEVESLRPSTDESDLGERNTSEDLIPLADGEPAVLSTPAGLQDNAEGDVEIVQSTSCTSSRKSLAREEEESDAPEVPACHTLVAESKFQMKVEEFLHFFFSDDAFDFQDSFHRKCGDKGFKCTEWRPDGECGHTRTVSFQHPIKIYFGGKFGGCQEVQKYRVYRNGHLVIETSQEISDVPYGDYFRVEGLWHVTRDTDESKAGCTLSVYTNVNFSKNTIFKGKIVQSTVDECRDAYAIWIDLAHELLKQKKVQGAFNSSQNDQDEVSMQKEERTETHLEKPTETTGNRTLAGLTNVSKQVNTSGGSDRGITSGTSFFSSCLVKFGSAMKVQSPSPMSLILVIGIAVILLLMQISILTLLSRPQQIQVIPQADWIYGVNNRGTSEAAERPLLDVQIEHLKVEMHIFERQLERMQREYALLKLRLSDLELHRNRET